MPTKKRIALAIIIIIVSTSVLGPFYLSYLDTKSSVDERYNELTKQPEPYTFEVPMYFNINGTSPIGYTNESDLGFLLQFTYPNETLVVNEPVFVNATAVIDKVIDTLDHITVVFPNSLVYPISYADNRLPLQGILTFSNAFQITGSNKNFFHNIYLVDEMTILFPQEGDYVPIIGLFFKDNSTRFYNANNVVVHVYPREQLASFDTERVSLSASQASLKLSEAVFILGIVSIVALVVQVLDHSETDCKYPKDATNPQNKQPEIKQQSANRFVHFKKKHKRTY